MAPDLMKDETWSGAQFDAKWDEYFKDHLLPVVDLKPMDEDELVAKVPRVARILGRMPSFVSAHPVPTAPPANA